MSKLTATLAIISLSLSLLSCQKEIGEAQSVNNNTAIQGDYKFISLETNTTVAVDLRDGADVSRTVTTSNYLTKENKGTIKIDAQAFNGNSVGYSVDTKIKLQSYFNGVMEEEEEVPFAISYPPSNSSAPYKLVGADSLVFTTGAMLVGGTAQQPSVPAGVKYKLEGTKLLLVQKLDAVKTERIESVQYTIATQGNITITLQRL